MPGKIEKIVPKCVVGDRATLGHSAGADLHRKQCDVLLLPEVSEIKIFDFKLYEKAISIGYDCSENNKDKLYEIFNTN